MFREQIIPLLLFSIIISVRSINTNGEIDTFWTTATQDEVRSRQSEHIQNIINFNINPCDDFVQYSCGNWYKTHSNPYFKTRQFGSDRLAKLSLNHAVYNFVNDLSQKESSMDQPQSAEEKLKTFYLSCLNEDKKQTTDLSEFFDVLKKYGGSAPLWNPNWNSSDFDWWKLTAFAAKFDIDLFFDVYKRFSYNYDNIDVTCIHYVKRGYYTLEEYVIYKEYVENVLQLTGINAELSKKAAENIVIFEKDLMYAGSSYGDSSETTLGEFIKKIPQFDWKKYFAMREEIDENALDLSQHIDYYENHLNKLIKLLTNQEPEKLANFMIWRMLMENINLFDIRYRNEQNKFYKKLDKNVDEEIGLDPFYFSRCNKDVFHWLSPIPQVLYFNKYFKESNENYLNTMFSELRETMITALNKSEWNDKNKTAEAVSAFNKLKVKIIRPEPNSIAELYELFDDLKLSPNEYIENWFNVRENYYKRSLNESGTIRDPIDHFTITSPVRSTQIEIPFDFLQPPIFHQYFPKAINFATFGTYLMHPLFVNKYFAQMNPDYKSKANSTRFSLNYEYGYEAYQFLVNNYIVEKSFETYEKWLTNSDSNEQLPVLNLTSKQLFFVSYTQSRCFYENDKVSDKMYIRDVLANSKGFQKAFACPNGSGMNPLIKADTLTL